MTTLPRMLRSVVPPPRSAVTWRSAAPLVVFLVGFVASWFVLEAAHVMLFSHRWPLALLIAIAPWVWWMHLTGHSGLSRGRAAVALWSRFMLLGLLVALLAEPRTVRSDERLSVMYVIDASASVAQPARDEAIKYVLHIVEGKPERDEAGLMFFGRNAAVELPPGMSLPLGANDRAMNVRIDRDGTDVAAALSTAAAVLPDDRLGRIILISDGVSTAGQLDPVLDDLRSRGIAVDVLPIDYRYEHEVWLERLELPQNVKVGETYEAAVLLSALTDGTGRLVLRENDTVIYDEPVTYHAGKNRFAVPIYLRRPGYYEYAAKIEPPTAAPPTTPSTPGASPAAAPVADSFATNNHAISYLYLKGQGQVLVIVDPDADERDWRPMVEAMTNAQREVTMVNAFEAPADSLALLPYDCVVLANVPRDVFSELQLQAIHDAVRQQGSGLLMVGGPNSFGPGAWARTPIEKALPVEMDIAQRKVMPKGALAIILHTCEFPQGNTWAKEITKQAIKVLSPQDDVGALAFGGRGDAWLFPMTPAADFQQLAAIINAAEIGDMPGFGPTMQMGLIGLIASDAASKHMIIISDGDASPPTPELLQQFRDHQVSVSTVSVFPHGGYEVSALQNIASATGGRYYPSPDDPRKLPAIFIKEAKTLRKSAIQNVTFDPRVENSSPILKGIDAMPPLEGFVLTTPKPRSNVVLRGPSKEDLDPVLATWRYGVGAAAVFTSDLSTNWGKRWIPWGNYEPFIKQLLTDISRASSESDLRMRTFAGDTEGVIVIDDYAADPAMLRLRAVMQGPRGSSRTVELEQTGPRRYEARFPLEGEGRYQVMAVGVGGLPNEAERNAGLDAAREQRVFGGFVVPYSAEYLRFRSNPIALRRIAERTGGRELRGDEESKAIYGDQREARRTSRPITDLLLLVLACLIPLDVGLRRVQLDWGVIGGVFRRRRAGVSDERMSALLDRKKQVADRLRAAEPVAPATPPPSTVQRPTPAAPKPAEPPADKPMSMTERLMAAKKRAQDQMKEKDKPADR